GRDAADDGDPLAARRLDALDERPHDRALIARREIGAAPLELVRPKVADGVEKRRLQPREREVETRHTRHGKRVGLRIALPRERVERRAARVREAEQARPLVERLTGGVVERRAEDAK